MTRTLTTAEYLAELIRVNVGVEGVADEAYLLEHVKENNLDELKFWFLDFQGDSDFPSAAMTSEEADNLVAIAYEQ